MIGKLKFELPKDKYDYRNAIEGHLWRRVVEDLDNYLRDMYKYQDKRKIKIKELRNKIYELMTDSNLSFDDLP
jgi:hypothetical protein